MPLSRIPLGCVCLTLIKLIRFGAQSIQTAAKDFPSTRPLVDLSPGSMSSTGSHLVRAAHREEGSLTGHRPVICYLTKSKSHRSDSKVSIRTLQKCSIMYDNLANGLKNANELALRPNSWEDRFYYSKAEGGDPNSAGGGNGR